MVLVKGSILSHHIVKNLLRVAAAPKTTQAMSEMDDVIFESVGDKGLITLNRPKALNSLNLSMISKLFLKLKQWENEKSCVIIKGTGEKAFCAGGDVRAIVDAGLKGERSYGHELFRKEYMMNGLIGSYKVPYIALIDGIVMGGGVGVSIHGRYRIATERTLFAMPETAIGLFPDVGGSYFMSRLRGKLGCFLALTGHRLKGADVLSAGIATHYCDSNKIKELEAALLQSTNENNIIEILKKYCTNPKEEFSLTPYLEKIDQYFASSTMEGIIEALKNDGTDWAKSNIITLLKMSPTSLKVALKEINLGANLTLQECLKMEYRLVTNFLANHDFYEGVRAVLIDRDHKPVWNPVSLSGVTDKIVDNYFGKLPEDQELHHKL